MEFNAVRFRTPVCAKDCPNRTITCKFDGTCDRYIKEREEVDKIKKAQYESYGQINGYYQTRKQRRAL